ncbi:MAG: hypothetical protein ABI621_14410 [Chloroflexota bacterium]
MRRLTLPILVILILILAACTSKPANPVPTQPRSEPVSNAVPTPTDDPALLPTLFPNTAGSSDDMTRTDEQGSVIFTVTPLHLGTPADSLEFDVVMNTHSIDLSMDLAPLATLATDAGVAIQAEKWDATPGGHHVEGKLVFPSAQDGISILEGASKLTLTIINVDAVSRVFEWELK